MELSGRDRNWVLAGNGMDSFPLDMISLFITYDLMFLGMCIDLCDPLALFSGLCMDREYNELRQGVRGEAAFSRLNDISVVLTCILGSVGRH